MIRPYAVHMPRQWVCAHDCQVMYSLGFSRTGGVSALLLFVLLTAGCIPSYQYQPTAPIEYSEAMVYKINLPAGQVFDEVAKAITLQPHLEDAYSTKANLVIKTHLSTTDSLLDSL